VRSARPVLDADAVDELKAELTREQWQLLLKIGLCVGCDLALRRAARGRVYRVQDADDGEEFDYGMPFPEETE